MLNILVKPFWLFLDMQVQVEVGTKYGLYHALLNASLILNILLDLGLSNYNNRKISVNNKRFSLYFENISIIRVGLAILYLIVLQIYGVIAGYSSYDTWLLFFLGLTQVFLSSILYIRSNFTAFGKFKLDSVFSVLDRLLMICGVLYLFANQSEGYVNIENFIFVQLIGYATSFSVGLLTLMVVGGVKWPKFQKRFSKILLKKSAPYALIVLLMAAYYSSDAIMIERILDNGEEETAMYAQSMRILMALNNYAYLFAVLLLPMFSKVLVKNGNVQSLIAASSSILLYGVSSLAILLAFFSEDVIAFCYGIYPEKTGFFHRALVMDMITNKSDVLISSEIFKLIIFGIVPMSINYCFGTLITASGNMKLLNKIAAISLGLNIILNFVLIPYYGAYGAAVSSLLTQSFSGVFQIVVAVKLFKLEVKLIGVLRFVFGVSFILFSTLFLSELSLIFRLPLIFVILSVGLLLAVNFKGIFGMAKGFGNNKQ